MELHLTARLRSRIHAGVEFFRRPPICLIGLSTIYAERHAVYVAGGRSRDHAERVLGHRIAGVEGTYDRYAYEDEKADALQMLATLIDQIVNPPDATNVVSFSTGAGVEVSASAS